MGGSIRLVACVEVGLRKTAWRGRIGSPTARDGCNAGWSNSTCCLRSAWSVEGGQEGANPIAEGRVGWGIPERYIDIERERLGGLSITAGGSNPAAAILAMLRGINNVGCWPIWCRLECTTYIAEMQIALNFVSL